MKLLIGLGNPEPQYQKTRHNAGYAFVDWINAQQNKPADVTAVKTNIAMNSSGTAVARLIKNFKLKTENLYVVHDDLDIPLGSFKIQYGRGPKDHNGIKSVDRELGTDQYWRIRIGIENREEEKIPGEEYTLQDFTPEEEVIIKQVYERLFHRLTDLR